MLREITEKEQPCECVNFVVTLMKVETTQTQCKCSTSPDSSQGNPTVLLCVLCMLYIQKRAHSYYYFLQLRNWRFGG